jgi:hypothetical protein
MICNATNRGANHNFSPILQPDKKNEDFSHFLLYFLATVGKGADKSLAFPICSTTKRIFLGWVNEVRSTKS